MRSLLLVAAIVGFSLAGCEKKNDAELTYNCVMNGYGSGHCTFTNASSTGTGAKCGKIKVLRRDTNQSVTSDVFCSGKVEASSSKKVEFSIPAVNSMCENEGKWTLVCAFDFLPND